MARKLFEFRATRARAGGLAVGIEYVVWDDEAATVLADISTSSGGSSIAGSTVTTADIAGLGPSACRFWGPTDDQDTLWVTCPSDPTLGVQRVEASTDARLDALEAGGGGSVAAHSADTTGVHGIADTTTLALKPVNADAIRYASGTGNDANDGFSWGSAKRTLQAAYDALPSNGGVVNVGFGRYDVTTGLALTRTKYANFQGPGPMQRFAVGLSGATYPHQGAVLHSSTGAVALVNANLPAATVINGYGFEFHGFVFELAGSTKYGIDGVCLNDTVVENCLFWGASTSADDSVGIICDVDLALGDDASWWRIERNVAGGVALCLMGQDTGTMHNSNQHVVARNKCYGRGAGVTSARPAIRFRGNHRTVARDNNLEAYAIGEQWESCWGVRSDANGGEQTTVFCDLIATTGSHFSPIGISQPDVDAAAVAVRGDIDSYNNLVVVANAGFPAGRAYTRYFQVAQLLHNENTVLVPGTTSFVPLGWSPATISNLALWLDASAIMGATDGTAMQTWVDQTGNGRHAVQATAGNKPTYKTSILNGKPVVRFDGTADHMDVPYAAALNASTFTLMIVVAATGALGTGNFRSPITNRTVSGGARGYLIYASDSDTWQSWIGDTGGSFNTVGTAAITVSQFVVLTVTYDSANHRMFVNGTQNATAASGTFGVNASSPLRLGAGQSEGAAGLYFPGDIAEVLVYGHALTTTERQQVERYLGAKYNLAVA